MQTPVIQCYKDLLREVNLLEFRDRKNNNFLHLFLKGIGKNERFSNLTILKLLNDYKEGTKYGLEDVRDDIQKLVIEENNSGSSPIGDAFDNNQVTIVNGLAISFIDYFEEKQENQAIDYIYYAA